MKEFKIASESDSFTISNRFVDKYIRDANASYIKIYLYMLRHSRNSGNLSLDKISADTGLLGSDVINAIKFWCKEGVMKCESSSDGSSAISILNLNASAPQASGEEEPMSEPEKHLYPADKSVISSYRAKNVVKTIQSDGKLAHLFDLIQQMLGKSLSANDYKIIYSFIDYLSLPDKVIIILFEYCTSIGKTNMRYIEKIAYSWADKGINTSDKALKYIKQLSENNSVVNHYRKLFKINGRDFSDDEEKMLFSWINTMNLSEEQIVSAYNISVLNTGKISFKYMDAVLKNEAENKSGASGRDVPSNVKNSKFRNYPPTYNISDAEKEMLDKMMSKYKGGVNNGND
ncbi:MAG: DnaD domain protein [Clostridia bacterium]|nr:DnaD domain protein [Clostridia bacterium]